MTDPSRLQSVTKKKPFYKKLWFWILIALLAVGMSKQGEGNRTDAASETPYVASATASESPSASESALKPDKYADIAKLNVVGMNWSDAYQKLNDAQIHYDDYTVETSDGKSVWMKSNWTVQSLSDSNGAAYIMLRHMTEEEQTVRNKLENAKDDLSSKIDDASTLLGSSEGEVANESTRDNLKGEIVQASSLDFDDPQRYEEEINSLQSAMDAVNESCNQKTLDDVKDSERQQPTSSPSQDQNVYYANCTMVRSAGKAPLYKGQPGYRYQLDRDNDGIACE